MKAEKLAKYERTPKAKKPNFAKLGVPSPFKPAFEKLTKVDGDGDVVMGAEAGGVVVLGGTRVIRVLEGLLRGPGDVSAGVVEAVGAIVSQRFHEGGSENVKADVYRRAFVRVAVSMVGRGVVGGCGIVYRATQEEYEFWKGIAKGKEKRGGRRGNDELVGEAEKMKVRSLPAQSNVLIL